MRDPASQGDNPHHDAVPGGRETSDFRGVLLPAAVPARRALVRGRTQSRRRLSHERGQALVEFVLLLPVFLVLVFGVIEFGRGINYWIDVTHLSNEASRYASVNYWPGCGKLSTDPCTPSSLVTYIEGRANTGELRSLVDVEFCYPDPGAGLTAGDLGTPVRATVEAEYELPLVGGLMDAMGLDGVGTLDLRSQSTARLEATPSRLPSGTTTC